MSHQCKDSGVPTLQQSNQDVTPCKPQSNQNVVPCKPQSNQNVVPCKPQSNQDVTPCKLQSNQKVKSCPEQSMSMPLQVPFGGGLQATSYPSEPTAVHPSQQQDYLECGQRQATIKSSGSVYPILNPTVVPAQNFDAAADVHALRNAMKGLGTDEATLIDILCQRSNDQRQKIRHAYKTLLGRDLLEDIRSETSGNFEKVLVALLTPIVDYYANELYDGMDGIGTDEDVLIEVLCSLTSCEIHMIKKTYLKIYGKTLESDLKSDTSGHFWRLLASLCAASRDHTNTVNFAFAARDAAALYKAGEFSFDADENVFTDILCQRNYPQLIMICKKYHEMAGHGLDVAIKEEFSGDMKEGLLAILQCLVNKNEFFASRLHKSMVGLGTTDKQLIRLLVTRCEVDLNDIKAAFERMYGKSLVSWIRDDTSGDYCRALIALCGEK